MASSSESAESSDQAASRAVVEAWTRSAQALEAERLRTLRALGETESALRFARLLQMPLPYPLRLHSGLVEQQRLFARLRDAKP